MVGGLRAMRRPCEPESSAVMPSAPDLSSRGPARGIALKLISVAIFLVMQTFIKLAGSGINAGQITFYRSAFALVPIVAYLALRHELRGAIETRNPFGHFKRGAIGILSMGCGFYGLVHLPLPEWIAINYAMPLFSVIFAFLLLGEPVRLYRWSAVMVGLFGVLIISWPKLTLFQAEGLESEQAIGAVVVLASAAAAALAMIQVRLLVQEEKTTTIVLYFSVIASALSLLTIPFGWDWLDLRQTLYLAGAGFCGGIAQIFLTESYRHADVSTIAPFEYTSILFGTMISFWVFGDVPTLSTLIGAAIVMAAGIFIIYREHRLGLERRAAKAAEKTL